MYAHARVLASLFATSLHPPRDGRCCHFPRPPHRGSYTHRVLSASPGCKRLCHRLRSLIGNSQLLVQCHYRAMCSSVEDLFFPGISSHEFLKSLEQWEMAWQKFDIGGRFARHRYQNILWTVEHIVQNGLVVVMRMRLVDSSWDTPLGWSYADISRLFAPRR